MDATADKRWLSVKDAAAWLGLGKSAIYSLVASKQLACYRIGPNGARLRFKTSDLAAYVEGQREGPRAKEPESHPRERYVPKYDLSKPYRP